MVINRCIALLSVVLFFCSELKSQTDIDDFMREQEFLVANANNSNAAYRDSLFSYHFMVIDSMIKCNESYIHYDGKFVALIGVLSGNYCLNKSFIEPCVVTIDLLNIWKEWYAVNSWMISRNYVDFVQCIIDCTNAHEPGVIQFEIFKELQLPPVKPNIPK